MRIAASEVQLVYIAFNEVHHAKNPKNVRTPLIGFETGKSLG
jgi:hypothetical protein